MLSIWWQQENIPVPELPIDPLQGNRGKTFVRVSVRVRVGQSSSLPSAPAQLDMHVQLDNKHYILLHVCCNIYMQCNDGC